MNERIRDKIIERLKTNDKVWIDRARIDVKKAFKEYDQRLKVQQKKFRKEHNLTKKQLGDIFSGFDDFLHLDIDELMDDWQDRVEKIQSKIEKNYIDLEIIHEEYMIDVTSGNTTFFFVSYDGNFIDLTPKSFVFDIINITSEEIEVNRE